MARLAPLAHGRWREGLARAPRFEGLAVAAGVLAFALLALAPVGMLIAGWLGRALADTRVLEAVLPSGRTVGLLANSVLLSTTTAAIAAVIGLGVAIWTYGDSRWQRLGRRVYLLPLLIPPYFHALALMAIAGRRQFLDQMAGLLFGVERLSLSAYGFWPATIVLAFAFAPIVTLLTIMGLEAIEPELVEQASLQRPSWDVARTILFPLLAPSLLAGAAIVFVLSMVEYGVPSALQFTVYPMEIYALFSQHNDPLRAAGSALPLLLPAVAVLAGVQWLVRSNPLRGQARRRLSLNTPDWASWARALINLGAACGALAIIGPLLVLTYRTGGAAVFPNALAGASRDIALTLTIGIATALAAAMVATLVACAFYKHQQLGKAGWALCALPMAIPAPLVGIAWIYLGSQPWLDWAYGTALPIVLTHLARLLPFAVFAAAAQVRRLDPLLFDAASLHKVAWWQRAHRIHLPLLAPALLLAFLVTFVLSLGELGASLMVAPPGQATLSMRIYNLMHYGATETVAALSLMLLALAAAVGGLVLALAKVSWRWTT